MTRPSSVHELAQWQAEGRSLSGIDLSELSLAEPSGSYRTSLYVGTQLSRGVDSMIASLSEAITKPATEIQQVPDLDDVLKDLEVVSSSPGSMRDMSRNELLGRDGEAFLNNIRRETLF